MAGLSESDWEKLQRLKAEGLAVGQRLGRDPEEPRQETKRDRRETREEPGVAETRAAERQQLRDLAREARKDDARASQAERKSERERGLARGIPDVPRPDDGFNQVFRDSEPNLSEGVSLSPSPMYVEKNDKHRGHYQPTPVVSPNQQEPFSPRVRAVNSLTLGFAVRDSDGTGNLTVYPSVITGLNASYLTPTLGGDELYDDPVPVLSGSADNWVFIKLEIEPEAVGNATPYTMSEANFTIVSNTIVQDTDASDAQPAEVDVTSGNTTNGIFMFPLAKLDANGTVAYQTMYGPFSASWCGGLVRVAPPVILHNGPIQDV